MDGRTSLDCSRTLGVGANGIVAPCLRRVGVVALGHHCQSMCPLMGVSPTVAWGTPGLSMPSTRMTSYCQPHQASVYPCCSRNPLPRCSSRVRFGVSATPSNIRNARMRPRCTTSKNRRRFPRAGFTGCSIVQSAHHSTLPAAVRGALSRSVMS
jgi:hypothetical protein